MKDLRYTTKCKCGEMVELVRDQHDARVFHFECKNCGYSMRVTADEGAAVPPRERDVL